VTPQTMTRRSVGVMIVGLLAGVSSAFVTSVGTSSMAEILVTSLLAAIALPCVCHSNYFWAPGCRVLGEGFLLSDGNGATGRPLDWVGPFEIALAGNRSDVVPMHSFDLRLCPLAVEASRLDGSQLRTTRRESGVRVTRPVPRRSTRRRRYARGSGFAAAL